MTRKTIPAFVATVVSCMLAGVALAGCEVGKEVGEEIDAELFEGTKKFTIGDHTVNVACAGSPVSDGPIIMLMHGGGDDVTKLADFQKTIGKDNRVCAYDRLGAGKSDKPEGEQDYTAVGKTLTGVIDKVANGDAVVLVGHSMGGLIAARYAPDNKDKVAGMVLLDATSPTAVADLKKRIPESATGAEGELRAQTLAIYGGENPEQLVFADGKVESAGDVPVRVIQHGQPYFEQAAPKYGPGLEQDWAKGQKDWLNVSSDSKLDTAKKSGHYIYTDEPDVAVAAVKDVASRVGG